MRSLHFPVKQAGDPKYALLVTGALVLSLPMSIALLLFFTSGENAPTADAGVEWLVFGLFLLPELLLAVGVAWMWFGDREIDVTDRGVAVRSSLMGIIWKSRFYPAHDIVDFKWKRTFPWRVNGRVVRKRSRCVYNYLLSLRGGQSVTLLATSSAQYMQSLGEALLERWPDGRVGAFSCSEEDAWWKSEPSTQVQVSPRQRFHTAWLLMAFGIPFLLAGGYCAVETYQMVTRGVRTQGKVVRVERCQDNQPTLLFVDKRGKQHRASPSVSASSPIHVGEMMELLYDPDRPEKIMITNVANMYLAPVILTLIGLALLTWGFLQYRKAKRL